MDHRHKRKVHELKLLEDNTRENPEDLGYGNDFLCTRPET